MKNIREKLLITKQNKKSSIEAKPHIKRIKKISVYLKGQRKEFKQKKMV